MKKNNQTWFYLMLLIQTRGIFNSFTATYLKLCLKNIKKKEKLNCFCFCHEKSYFQGNWQPVGNVFAHLSTIFVFLPFKLWLSFWNGSFHLRYVEIFSAKIWEMRSLSESKIMLAHCIRYVHVFLIPCHVSPLKSCIEFIKGDS